MADGDKDKKPIVKRGTFVAEGGQPVEFVDEVEVAEPTPVSSLGHAILQTLREYRRAASALLGARLASFKELAPPHLRSPCNILIICCPDGVLVRYDRAGGQEPKMRVADATDGLAKVAPQFSDQVIHFPQGPATYVPNSLGPSLVLSVTDSNGNTVDRAQIHPVIYASTVLPPDFVATEPPSRPPPIVSIHNELQMQLHGAVLPENTPPGAVLPGAEHFIAHGTVRLAVGWEAVEVYPLLGEEHWKPEYAASWAELDLFAAAAQANAMQVALNQLDGRAHTREYYARLIEDFESLLAGAEEPCHQFLKAHPELICATHDAMWSKLRFGRHVSDFVFREPINDYLLVEIEAPHREIFRKDGQQLEALTHAVNQIDDWLQYIQDNKGRVEAELGLTGISATPRTLIVIGRSASLTDENRKKLAVLQGQRPRLRIVTYDEMILTARANLARLLGPLSPKGKGGVRLYFYREKQVPGRSVPATSDDTAT
jgi:hypothetical protein